MFSPDFVPVPEMGGVTNTDCHEIKKFKLRHFRARARNVPISISSVTPLKRHSRFRGDDGKVDYSNIIKYSRGSELLRPSRLHIRSMLAQLLFLVYF